MTRNICLALLLWLPLGLTSSEINQEALAALLERAEKSGSDAVVILHDGELVGEWTFDKPKEPLESGSVTMGVVALAIGALIDDGRIASADTPIYTLYPQWRQGRKKDITLRQILTHTSGLQNQRSVTREILPSNDFIELALAAELSDDPGGTFAFNNKAVNLLAGVIQKVSGQRMDEYIGERIFAPLGITDFSWTLDNSGNPHGMSGLKIHAADLAKIGQLVLDRGTWRGERVISETWIDEMLTIRQEGMFHYSLPCGYLWWLVPEWERATFNDEIFAIWREAGVDEAYLAKIEPLKGKTYEKGNTSFFSDVAEILGGEEGLETWYDNTWRRELPDTAVLRGPTVAYRADGQFGQYLVIVPETGIVAVRQMRTPTTAAGFREADRFEDFTQKVVDLVER